MIAEIEMAEDRQAALPASTLPVPEIEIVQPSLDPGSWISQPLANNQIVPDRQRIQLCKKERIDRF